MVTEEGYVKRFFEQIGLDKTPLNPYFLETINYASIEDQQLSNIIENSTPKKYIYTTNTQRISSLGKDLMLIQLELPEGIVEVLGFDEQNAYFSKNKGIIYDQGIKKNSDSETTLRNIIALFNTKTFYERMNVENINQNHTYKVKPHPEEISDKCKNWIKGR